jgi:DNA-binding NarL/FixJ family response regulator
MITILVVDDEPIVREGLRMRLSAEVDMTIVGEAADGQNALALAAVHHPNVVLVDVNMPRTDGILVTRALRAANPEAAVVMLSIHDDPATRACAAAAGAAAFVTKRGALSELLGAIRRAAEPGREVRLN